MKKAEIIKNGNVNLKAVKLDKKVNKEIDWRAVTFDFIVWEDSFIMRNGGLPSQKQTVAWFKKRLSIGFDHVDTGVCVMARPTKSLTLYLQSVGRVARLKTPNFVSKFGQNAIILDIVDNTSKHNLINAWELDRQKPVEERTFVSREKKDKLLAERQRKLLEHTRDKDERVALLKIPKLKVRYSGKWKESATEKQLEWIYSLGYPKDSHYTKEQCNQIILSLPATEKQVGLVKYLGYNLADKTVLTRADVEAVIQDAKAKNNPKAKNL